MVNSSKQKRLSKPNTPYCPTIPCNVNHFEVLSEPVKVCVQEMRLENRDTIQKKGHKQKGRKHKIIIIGDSHARGCAAEIKANLNEGFEVQGFVSPGAGLKTISSTAKNDIQKLSRKDVVVVWGGSKDVGKN
jgi:hypothetical protein